MNVHFTIHICWRRSKHAAWYAQHPFHLKHSRVSVFFHTMTCNLQWPKFKQVLLPGTSVTDCLHCAVCVFCIKLCAFVAFVINEYIFREVEAHVRAFKLQKSRLPHANCVIFLTFKFKLYLSQPSFVDKILFADIPCAKSSNFCQVVLKHNIQNLCVELKPSVVFMDDGN